MGFAAATDIIISVRMSLLRISAIETDSGPLGRDCFDFSVHVPYDAHQRHRDS